MSVPRHLSVCRYLDLPRCSRPWRRSAQLVGLQQKPRPALRFVLDPRLETASITNCLLPPGALGQLQLGARLFAGSAIDEMVTAKDDLLPRAVRAPQRAVRTTSVSAMGDLLVQGWKMMAESCDTCGVRRSAGRLNTPRRIFERPRAGCGRPLPARRPPQHPRQLADLLPSCSCCRCR